MHRSPDVCLEASDGGGTNNSLKKPSLEQYLSTNLLGLNMLIRKPQNLVLILNLIVRRNRNVFVILVDCKLDSLTLQFVFD